MKRDAEKPQEQLRSEEHTDAEPSKSATGISMKPKYMILLYNDDPHLRTAEGMKTEGEEKQSPDEGDPKDSSRPGVLLITLEPQIMSSDREPHLETVKEGKVNGKVEDPLMKNVNGKSGVLCKYCNKEFSKKKYLTQHVKRTHYTQLGKGPPQFNCTYCDKIYRYNINLQRHIEIVHLSSNELTLCEKCPFRTHFKNNLKRHMTLMHSKNKDGPIVEHNCRYCESKFFQKKHLLRHIKEVHASQRKVRRPPQRKCPLCSFISLSKFKKEIHNHFSAEHGVIIKREEHQFENLDEFHRWLCEVEKSTNTYYSLAVKSEKIIWYECHRRGNYERKREMVRKSRGVCKINGFCPSECRLNVNKDNTVSVLFLPTHLGHTNDLRIIRGSRDERNRSVDCVLTGVEPRKKKLNKKRIQEVKPTLTIEEPVNIYQENYPEIDFEQHFDEAQFEEVVTEIDSDDRSQNNKISEIRAFMEVILNKLNTDEQVDFVHNSLKEMVTKMDDENFEETVEFILLKNASFK